MDLIDGEKVEFTIDRNTITVYDGIEFGNDSDNCKIFYYKSADDAKNVKVSVIDANNVDIINKRLNNSKIDIDIIDMNIDELFTNSNRYCQVDEGSNVTAGTIVDVLNESGNVVNRGVVGYNTLQELGVFIENSKGNGYKCYSLNSLKYRKVKDSPLETLFRIVENAEKKWTTVTNYDTTVTSNDYTVTTNNYNDITSDYDEEDELENFKKLEKIKLIVETFQDDSEHAPYALDIIGDILR